VGGDFDAAVHEPIRSELSCLQCAPHGTGNDGHLGCVQRWRVEAVFQALAQRHTLLDAGVGEQGIGDVVSLCCGRQNSRLHDCAWSRLIVNIVKGLGVANEHNLWRHLVISK
jgi:hypothetical protein